MKKEFSGWDEMHKAIHDDIMYIYNRCESLSIVTNKVEDVEKYIDDFIDYMCADYENVSLFRVRDRYTINLTCIGNCLEGVIWKQNNIIEYHDRFMLEIYDSVKSVCLSGHPFINMGLDDIVNYLQNDCISKSDNFKFKYDLVKDGNIVYSLYGSDNTVVKDYFKYFGGKNIRTSRISSNESLYTMIKDGEEYKFMVRRSTIK